MIKTICRLGLSGLFLLSTSRIYATGYYVSPTGADTNPGTLSQPWKTIQKAATTMVAGDTVFIRGGTYYEMVTPAKSGTAAQPITYQNYNGEQVVIDAQSGTRASCIEVYGKGYLTFVGLTLTGATGPNTVQNAGFRGQEGANHLTLDNLRVVNNRLGIMFKGKTTAVTDITVKNTTVTENAAHGIFVYYKNYNVDIGPNNHITTNGFKGDYAFGIDVTSDYPGVQANGSKGVAIFDNEIDHNDIQGIRTWNAVNVLIRNNYIHHNGASGIQIENGSENVVIDSNRSEYNAQTYEYETGAWLDDTTTAIVQNNTFRGNKIGLMVTASNQALLRNNLIYENNRGVPNTYNSMGVNLNTSAANVYLIHNTLWRNGTSDSSKGGLSFCSSPPVTNAVIKNNIIAETTAHYDIWASCAYQADYNHYSNSRALVINWLGTTYSWSNYVSTSGQDGHSFTGAPQFANTTNQDFTLVSTSPDIDSGDFLTTTTAAGSGTSVPVKDVRFFSDGLNLIAGDKITIGTNSGLEVLSVDYSANLLTVNRTITWRFGDGVSYLFAGQKPDRGAFEFNGQATLSPTPSPANKPGDANDDQLVNETDYSIWYSHYLQSFPDVASGNFNQDNRIDGIDYVIWLTNLEK